MATIALAFGGAALGGSLAASAGVAAGTAVFAGLTASQIGASIGGLAGAFLDQLVVYPLIFGRPNLSGPRLQDTPPTTVNEGDPCILGLGAMIRTSGQVIWCSDRRDYEDEQDAKGGGGGGSTWKYRSDVAVEFCREPVEEVLKIFTDTKIAYEDSVLDGRKASGLNIYTGTQTEPDAVIVARTGEDQPAYLGRSYFVITDLVWEHFGNRQPQWSVIFAQNSEMTLGQGIQAVIARGDSALSSSSDVSSVPNCLTGLLTVGAVAPLEDLQRLTLAHRLEVQDVAGSLVFYERGQQDVFDVPAEDLIMAQDERAGPVRITSRDRLARPTEVSVAFADTGRNLQRSAATYRIPVAADRSPAQIDLTNVSMSFAEAAALAQDYVLTQWEEDSNVEFSLGPAYSNAIAGDDFLIRANGRVARVRSTKVDIGKNGEVRVEGIVSRKNMERVLETVSARGPGSGSPVYSPPAEVHLEVLDLPPLTAEMAEVGVLLILAAAAETDDTFVGSVIYEDAGFGLKSVGAVPREATIGTATVSGSPDTAPTVWDELTTITVHLPRKQLEGREDEDVLAGANTAILRGAGGVEVFSFGEAELVAANTYVLRRLRRALRGTPLSADGVYVFALVSDGSPLSRVLSASAAGSTYDYQALPSGGLPSNYPSESVSILLRSLMPLPPVQLEGERDGSGNLTISWKPVSRIPGKTLGIGSYLNDGDGEEYLVEILDGGTVVREIPVSGATETIYTSAQQTTDFGSTQGAIDVRVSKISPAVGAGDPAEATL